MDDYKERLVKYIPVEVIAVYLTLDLLAHSVTPVNTMVLWLAFGAGILGSPLYLWRIYGVSKVLQLLLCTLSFAVWVFALGGRLPRTPGTTRCWRRPSW